MSLIILSQYNNRYNSLSLYYSNEKEDLTRSSRVRAILYRFSYPIYLSYVILKKRINILMIKC